MRHYNGIEPLMLLITQAFPHITDLNVSMSVSVKKVFTNHAFNFQEQQTNSMVSTSLLISRIYVFYLYIYILYFFFLSLKTRSWLLNA